MRTILNTMLLSCALGTVACKSSLSVELGDRGFSRVLSPRATMLPGTVVRIERTTEGVRPIILCSPNDAFPGLPEPRSSETSTIELKSVSEGGFNLETDYLDTLIEGSAKFSAIDSVSMSFQRAVVIEHSTRDLYKALRDRDEFCKEAVAMDKASGYEVLTILQALRADIVYTVKTKAEAAVQVGAPKELLEGLKAELGANTVNEKEQTIKGKELIWGIKLEKIGEVAGAEPGAELTEADRKRLSGLLLYNPTDKSLADMLRAKKKATP